MVARPCLAADAALIARSSIGPRVTFPHPAWVSNRFTHPGWRRVTRAGGRLVLPGSRRSCRRGERFAMSRDREVPRRSAPPVPPRPGAGRRARHRRGRRARSGRRRAPADPARADRDADAAARPDGTTARERGTSQPAARALPADDDRRRSCSRRPRSTRSARALAEHRVIERVARPVLAAPEIEDALAAMLEEERTRRLVEQALDSQLAAHVTDHLLQSPELERAVEQIASSAAVRAALVNQIELARGRARGRPARAGPNGSTTRQRGLCAGGCGDRCDPTRPERGAGAVRRRRDASGRARSRPPGDPRVHPGRSGVYSASSPRSSASSGRSGSSRPSSGPRGGSP